MSDARIVIPNLRVAIPEWLFHRIIIVAYLYPPPDAFSKYADVELNARAVKVLYTHVRAFVEKGKEPPAQIRSVVMNVADDLANNRTPTLRTGDYIDLQSFVRK